MSRNKGTTWVLETQTKGTGATMVPLERTLAKPGEPVPGFPLPDRRPVPEPDAEPRGPRRFRVVDVVSREVLSDGTDARATIDSLQKVRSIVDVTVYVWEPDDERWRLLTLVETRALWDYRASGTNDLSAGSQQMLREKDEGQPAASPGRRSSMAQSPASQRRYNPDGNVDHAGATWRTSRGRPRAAHATRRDRPVGTDSVRAS